MIERENVTMTSERMRFIQWNHLHHQHSHTVRDKNSPGKLEWEIGNCLHKHFKSIENRWLIMIFQMVCVFSLILNGVSLILAALAAVRTAPNHPKTNKPSVFRNVIRNLGNTFIIFNFVFSPIWTNYVKWAKILSPWLLFPLSQACKHSGVASKSIKTNEHKLMWEIQNDETDRHERMGKTTAIRVKKSERASERGRGWATKRDVSKSFNGFIAKWNHPLSHHHPTLNAWANRHTHTATEKRNGNETCNYDSRIYIKQKVWASQRYGRKNNYSSAMNHCWKKQDQAKCVFASVESNFMEFGYKCLNNLQFQRIQTVPENVIPVKAFKWSRFFFNCEIEMGDSDLMAYISCTSWNSLMQSLVRCTKKSSFFSFSIFFLFPP